MKLGNPLKPVSIRNIGSLRKLILESIEEILYKPLLLPELSENQIDDLIKKSIADGVLQYEVGTGLITGTFNSKIVAALRLQGAEYNRRLKGYIFDELGDNAILDSILAGEDIKKIRAELTLQRLATINTNGLENYNPLFSKVFDNVLGSVNKQLKIGIDPVISKQVQEAVAINYSSNLELVIQKFINEEVLELRQLIQDNVLAGKRSTSVQKIIQRRFKVSQSKAKFLASQETRLLQSEYSEQKYKEIGVQRYKWSTSKDIAVRSSHAKLDGQMFYFDNPPIVDEKTGRQANPGKDFGCRCVAIPVFEEV